MKFTRTILPNGLRLITVPLKDSQAVTVLVMVEAGSKYETKEQNGISHFLEHICFKGTKNRPRAIDISRELDSMGAQYNAFTTQEFTGYFAKSAPKHFEKILEIIADLYLNPVLVKEEIEKEKGVIIEEINMYEDLPQKNVQDVFMELLYRDQPAGWNIAGTKENVRSFTAEDILKYRDMNYVSGATAVVIAGNFDEKHAVHAVTRYFSDMSSGEKHIKTKVVEDQKKPEFAIKEKATDQMHFVLGARSFDVYDPRNPAARILSAVLGGGMSSRLFEKMRNELGICYYIGASNETFTDHGFFSVAAGVDNSRFHEALKAVMKELSSLKHTLVSSEEIRKTKDFLIGNLTLSLETSDAVAEHFGFQEIMRKKIKMPSEVIKEVESQKAENIMKIAKEIFRDNRLNLAAVGSKKNSADIGVFLRFS